MRVKLEGRLKGKDVLTRIEDGLRVQFLLRAGYKNVRGSLSKSSSSVLD